MKMTELGSFGASAIDDLDYFWIDDYNTDTVTITVASPGVISWSSHGLPINTPIVFSTTGDLPTGITAGTTYYVASSGYSSNSFSISASIGGSLIITTGTQSGMHTAVAYVSKKISGAQLKALLGSVSYSQTITPATVGTANTITHNLGTTDIAVVIWDVDLNEIIYADINNRTSNSVDITFGTNPSGDIRVVVFGRGSVNLDIRPYYTISGTVTQSSTSAPTLVIIENTFPVNVSTSYSETGTFSIDMIGQFTDDTFVNCFYEFEGNDQGTKVKFLRNSINSIKILTYNSENTLANGILTNHSFEIRYKK